MAKSISRTPRKNPRVGYNQGTSSSKSVASSLGTREERGSLPPRTASASTGFAYPPSSSVSAPISSIAAVAVAWRLVPRRPAVCRLHPSRVLVVRGRKEKA